MQIKKAIKSSRVFSLILYPFLKIRKRYQAKKFLKEYTKLHNLLGNAKAGVLTFTVREFGGDFDVNVHSDLSCRLLLYSDYEPKTVKLLEKYINHDRDIIDVGANIGFFSVFFAKSINDNQKVLAIEPTPGAYQLLKSNLDKNNCSDKVIFFNGVASDNAGDVYINVVPGMEEYSSIGKLTHSSVIESQGTSLKVPSETLDHLVHKYNLNPGIIKIDVEGAEYLVLQGAEETIKKYSPVFLIEVSDHLSKNLKTNSFMVFKFLKNLGYTLVSIDGADIKMSGEPGFNGDVLAVKSLSN